MAKKVFTDFSEEKEALGEKIKEARGKTTLRSFANAIGIPPSNLSYIERGLNAPSQDVYLKIISISSLTNIQKREMDKLYEKIRGVPSPEVCNIILGNDLTEIVKLLTNKKLTEEKKKQMKELFESF